SFSKEREPAVEEVEVNAVVRDVLEVVQGRAAGRGVHIETRLGELPVCQADPEGLHRALLNIVTNAFDAVEERTNPQVGVLTRLEPGSDGRGDWVRITVLDNGPGIPPDHLVGLFRPFHSTKGARGTGLGLAVSRKILREHGGDIFAENIANNRGARF